MNIQLIVIIVAGVLFLGSLGKAYHSGYTSCVSYQVKSTLNLSEKRNEIRNNRPDDAAFFDQLLNDPNW